MKKKNQEMKLLAVQLLVNSNMSGNSTLEKKTLQTFRRPLDSVRDDAHT